MVSEATRALSQKITQRAKPVFEEIDRVAEKNAEKMLEAFQEYRVLGYDLFVINLYVY